MKRRDFLAMAGAGIGLAAFSRSRAAGAQKMPNIIFMMADDIGYGDWGCYGAVKVRTPNLDRLAAQGRRFTDAHSPSAVCTPTRYALMTGEYAWRKPGTGILPGTAPLIIEPGRVTVASLLKEAGYATACLGKWHLGLGDKNPTDYNGEIKPGPLEVGFDHCFIIPATGDRTPCVWVEDHRVVGLDPADPIKLDYTVKRGEPRSFVSGIPRIGEQTGGKAALWKDEEIADTLAARAVKYIEEKRDKPFFLYFCTHDIHVPRVPHPRFKGTSQAGVRGDVIQEFDWTVGQVMEALDRAGLADNTLLIVTSDNGGVLDANGPDTVHGGTVETNNGHLQNGPLRGTKGSPYEGGTRVPFIARWPGRVAQGTSGELICHIDLLATFAALTGRSLKDEAGPDSFNVLPALLGEKLDKPCREYLVEHGSKLALRRGPWKYIEGAGGRAGKKKDKARKAPAGAAAPGELYNLDSDIGETKNLAAERPEIVRSMAAMLEEIRNRKRSRP